MQTMYSAMVNSPATVITSGHAFTTNDTTLYVDQLSCFPTAPNIVVMGTGDDAVAYIYSAKSAASGAGTLTIPSNPQEGTEKSWAVGTAVYRGFCAYDHDSFKANIEGLVTFATKTIYVDKAATGTGDGTSWANAFTTIQGAIDSIPAVVAHDQLIIVKKGSTDYSENLYFSRVPSGGVVTIQGQYYYRSTNDSSKTGKLDIKSDAVGYADRAQIAAGDIVWGLKFSGTVWSTYEGVTDSIRDTVASISGTEITLTTNSGKAFDTSWGFCVVKTKIIDNAADTLKVSSYCPLNITGLALESNEADYNAILWEPNITGTMSTCYIKATNCDPGVITKGALDENAEYCYFYNATADVDCYTTTGSKTTFTNCVFEATANASSSCLKCLSTSTVVIYCCRFAVGDSGVVALSNTSIVSVGSDNDGTVPWTPAAATDGAYISVY